VSEQTRRKEIILDNNSKEVLKKRSEASFKKEERASEGAEAKLEYEARMPLVKKPHGWPRKRRRVSNHPIMPTWRGDVLMGAALGALVFLGLTLLLVGGGMLLAHWL
jgi:hypothetical protein